MRSALVAAAIAGILVPCTASSRTKTVVTPRPGARWQAVSEQPRVLAFRSEPLTVTIQAVEPNDVKVEVSYQAGSAGACATAMNVSSKVDVSGRNATNAEILATMEEAFGDVSGMCGLDTTAVRRAATAGLRDLTP